MTEEVLALPNQLSVEMQWTLRKDCFFSLGATDNQKIEKQVAVVNSKKKKKN